MVSDGQPLKNDKKNDLLQQLKRHRHPRGWQRLLAQPCAPFKKTATYKEILSEND